MFRFSFLLSVTLLLTVRTYNHPAPRATTRRAAIEKIGFPLLILTTTPHAAMAAKVPCDNDPLHESWEAVECVAGTVFAGPYHAMAQSGQ